MDSPGADGAGAFHLAQGRFQQRRRQPARIGRRFRREDAEQAVVAQKLDLIDKWGKIVTVLAVVYGVILGGLYAWQAGFRTAR
jgi:hypothetical protein